MWLNLVECEDSSPQVFEEERAAVEVRRLKQEAGSSSIASVYAECTQLMQMHQA